MKQSIRTRGKFVFKSMLWSLLLYIGLMLAFNWDDVRIGVSGANPITIVTNSQQSSESAVVNPPVDIQSNITRHKGVLKSVVSLVKIISGIADAAGK